jgi:hypothetical protein
MIKHVVMWKLKDAAGGHDKMQNRQIMKEKLAALKPKIRQIESLEVGFNINRGGAAYDVVLITTHSNTNDLSAYAEHPSHKEVAGFISSVVQDRKVVDFEY